MTQVWELLPPNVPAMAHLRALDLSGYMLWEMPDSSARSPTKLTSLTWRHSPIMEIPPALSLIHSLQKLKFSNDEHLLLGPASVKPLLALEHLSLLGLNNSRLRVGKRAIQGLTNRLPHYCTVKFGGWTYTPRKGEN